MFKLDNNFLVDLGLGSLPPAEKNKMLSHIYETLEMKVGMRLAEKMTNEQLDEFESYINSNDEQGALKWLESNFPNYKQVVAEELEKLKSEIKQVSPQIVAQAESSATSAPAAQPAMPAQSQQPQQPLAPLPDATSQPSYAPVAPQPAYPQPQYAQSDAATPQSQQQFDQPYPAPVATDPYASAAQPVQQFDQSQQFQPSMQPAYPPAASSGNDFDLSRSAPTSGGVAQPLPPAPDPLPPAASSDFGQQPQYDSAQPAYAPQQPVASQQFDQPQFDQPTPPASDFAAFDDPSAAGLAPSDPYASLAQPPLQQQQQPLPQQAAMPMSPMQQPGGMPQQQPQPYAQNDYAQNDTTQPAPLSSPSQRPIEPYQPPTAPAPDLRS